MGRVGRGGGVGVFGLPAVWQGEGWNWGLLGGGIALVRGRILFGLYCTPDMGTRAQPAARVEHSQSLAPPTIYAATNIQYTHCPLPTNYHYYYSPQTPILPYNAHYHP